MRYLSLSLLVILSCGGETKIEDPGVPVCGDLDAEGFEFCDGTDLRQKTCATVKATAPTATGTLSCSTDCYYNTTGCAGLGNFCGNGVREGGENCDSTDMAAGNDTCAEQNFTGTGTIRCLADCQTFDLSACGAPSANCGNGTRAGAEQCDGAALNGQTCITLDYVGGDLACNANCSFDVKQCTF